MKKVIAIGASNSTKSINKKLANYAANQLTNAEVEVLDINDFHVHMYGVDYEAENGIPEAIITFANKIDQADFLVISLAEHNGSYTAEFKSVMDWMSRIQGRETWGNKKMLLISTSPGKRGALDVMAAALARFPYLGAEVVDHFSLPSFYENFDDKLGIINSVFKKELHDKLNKIHL